MSTSVYDFGGTIKEQDDGIHILKLCIKEKQPKRLIFRVRKSDHKNGQWLTLLINENDYDIHPSYFVKRQKRRSELQHIKQCDNYEIIFGEKNVYLCKENQCVDEIQIKEYPVEIIFKGEAMLMDRIDIQ